MPIVSAAAAIQTGFIQSSAMVASFVRQRRNFKAIAEWLVPDPFRCRPRRGLPLVELIRQRISTCGNRMAGLRLVTVTGVVISARG